MQIGTALVTHGQLAEAIEPDERAFDHPAVATEAFARLDATARNAWDDASLAAGSTTAWVVVALVGVRLDRAPTRPTASAMRLADRRNGIQRCR